jgi:hypothetical protein
MVIMTDLEVQAWAEAFIAAQSDPNILATADHPQWWAVERFMKAGTSEAPAHDCFRAILRALAMNPPEDILAILAAGPLEDLVHYCGEEIIQEIEREASDNSALRHLLCGIYESSTPDVWARIKACRKK